MALFGLTKFGYQNTLKEMVRNDYKDPKNEIQSNELLHERLNGNNLELTDCNGFPYGSNDRLLKAFKKGEVKALGPKDIYRQPICSSMTYGWILDDEPVRKSSWHKVVNSYRKQKTDIMRYLDEAMKSDKNFFM